MESPPKFSTSSVPATPSNLQQQQHQNQQPPALVAVSVPILPPDGTYVYIVVKGSLYSADTAVFGLNQDEIRALANRFSNSSTRIDNGVLINGSPIHVINSLSQLGYKVICSTGEAEVMWTMQREV